MGSEEGCKLLSQAGGLGRPELSGGVSGVPWPQTQTHFCTGYSRPYSNAELIYTGSVLFFSGVGPGEGVSSPGDY